MKYIHTLVRLAFLDKNWCSVIMPSRGIVRRMTWEVEQRAIAAPDGKQEVLLYPALLVESEVGAERKLRRFVIVGGSTEVDSAEYGGDRLRYVDGLEHPRTGQLFLFYEVVDPRPMPVAASNDLPAVSGEINGSEVATPVSSPSDHCDACAGVELAAHTHQEGA